MTAEVLTPKWLRGTLEEDTCNFCKRPKSKVARLIANHNKTRFVCDACITIFKGMIGGATEPDRIMPKIT